MKQPYVLHIKDLILLCHIADGLEAFNQDLEVLIEKLSKKISNKTALFAIVGVVLGIIAFIIVAIKIKNRLELISDDEDFYCDDEDFYEDYHALDYEEDEE